MPSYRTNPTMETYRSTFNKMVESAPNFQNSDMKPWVREQTLVFLRTVTRDFPFATVYNQLLKMIEEKTEENRKVVAKKASQEFTRVSKRRTTSEPTELFPADNQQTSAEYKKARTMLNQILFREYTNWYDAFVLEAEEDNDDIGADAPTRFSWHCAKIISKMTGLRADLIEPLVHGWVLSHINQ